MSDVDKIPKKRGRKPKNNQSIPIIQPIKKNLNSDEEPLITHLSINLNDITNIDTTNVCDSDSIFIKQEFNINNNSNINNEETNTETNIELNELDKLEKEIIKLKYKIFKLTRKETIDVTNSNFKKNTKCWWCKHTFETPSVSLPESYFNNKFLCIGNFCSYNCAMSYNIDMNDNVSKKTSLLNLLYYMTYGLEEKIKIAPDWRMLEDYGGNLSIDKFRKSSLVNNCDYTLLHPPLETRVHKFEKNYKLQTSLKSNSLYQQLLEDTDELILKRSNPIKSNQYSLDKTMFIKKKEKQQT